MAAAEVSAQEIADADIASLTRHKQHPLSLADLVKYVFSCLVPCSLLLLSLSVVIVNITIAY